MTKLRRTGSMDFGNGSMTNVLDVAKALCLACKQRSKPKRSFSLFHIKSCPEEAPYAVARRTTAAPRMEAGGGGARSQSVSSEGSADSGPLVEQEDIIVLTHDVRSFKEALGKLRRIFHPERDRSEAMRVSAHERLGEVLRILRSILEKYPPIQSTELLMAAGTLIQQVKGYNYEDEKSDPSNFFEAIDQLALAFSSRVSEYLMGDLDSSSQPVPKTRSCDNLLSTEGECDPFVRDKRFTTTLPPEEIDARLARLSDGVDLALRRAKVWSKYAKDVMTYIEKRCSAEAEHAKNLVKLAQTMRPILKEESFLPFQSIYYMALDQDYDNGQTSLKTCAVLQGHKFIEPLTARRNEHEKYRKQIKETWHRELKRMHESVANLRKSKALYYQRQQEYEKAKDSAQKAESSESAETSKVDKKKRVEDDALQKAMEAETTYKSCVLEANERQLALEKVKGEVLQQVRELIYQCDQTMKAVTVGYFQLQSTLSAHAPVQFQTLCESSRLYEPGTQYMEFVKRLPQPTSAMVNGGPRFSFEPYLPESRLDKSRKSNGSTESEDILNPNYLEPRYSSDSNKEKTRIQQPIKAWGSPAPTGGSDSDSMSSCPSNKSQDTSPTASPHISTRKVVQVSSGDELETDHDNADAFGQARRPCMSKAAETHTFKRLKTPSRCRECDSYVYFHGFECFECGLASHKKCLESLAIQCGRKRLPRKMTTFGVDLSTQACESGEEIPYIVQKCIAEVEEKGCFMKGIYRVSGVKSRVEKLCQSFENGAELVDLEGVHPNVVSNVLKLYLRQLPEPLLTYRLYPDFIKVAKDFPAQKIDGGITNANAVEDLRKLVQKLPSVHFATLAYLMHHLFRVSKHSDHNNMPPSNLGIVFGPTLLRTSEGSASLSSLVDTVHQTRVIELLIMHAYEIFGHPKTSSSQNEMSQNQIQAKSLRYRGSNPVSRTVSGSSQASDIEEQSELDHRREGIIDLDDYPIPGYLPTDKSQETESLHQNSDLTHSSDDLLYPNVMSDDDYPEIPFAEDSVFKKASIYPSVMNQYSELKSNGDISKSSQTATHMKVFDARASLSSSPAVSEASHCSSLLRSTDDESVSDPAWKEGLLPSPSPKKHVPANLQLNQSKVPQDKTPGASSVSESSGVSSAASTSPMGGVDTSQSDPNLYTSTAVLTLAGQKSPSRTSASLMTAELRRQFFELPPPLTAVCSGTPPPLQKAGASADFLKSVESVEGASAAVEFTGKAVEDSDSSPPGLGPPPKLRGSSRSYASAADSLSSNVSYGRDERSRNAENIQAIETTRHHSEGFLSSLTDSEFSESQCFSSRKVESIEQSSLQRTEMISFKQFKHGLDRSTIVSDIESLSTSAPNKKGLETTTGSYSTESQTIRAAEKLSPNRQPRFV